TFFFPDSPTPHIYTLSLHDALPILFLQPCLQGFAIPPGQEIEYAAALQIDQDRAVALALADGPVIDADHPRRQQRLGWSASMTEIGRAHVGTPVTSLARRPSSA